MVCSRLWERGVVLAGVKAKPYGWPALTPAPGDTDQAVAGSGPGFKIKGSGMLGKSVWGVGLGSSVQFLGM